MPAEYGIRVSGYVGYLLSGQGRCLLRPLRRALGGASPRLYIRTRFTEEETLSGSTEAYR